MVKNSELWTNKNLFKKLFITSVYNDYINIPTLTGSKNWDSSNLVFISGLKEINTLNYTESFYKQEIKTGDLEYKIVYKPLNIKKDVSKTPNNNIFNTSYKISNAYYTRCQLKTSYTNKGGEITFDLYEDNKFKQNFKFTVWTLPGSHYTSWVVTIYRIRINHPNLKEHTYTFKNLKISGSIDSNITMSVMDSYVPDYDTESSIMGTNILFGENVKLIKNK